MLILKLTKTDDFDAVEVHLEHSLASLSKWEAQYEKPFYSPKDEKSEEEMADYIKYMVIDAEIPLGFIERLTHDDAKRIGAYINAKQSATWFNEDPNKPPSREIITSELIYYWMIGFKIPFSCENWHLNRLMTLIRICSIKQSKPKPMSKQAWAQQARMLNAQRKAELGTSG